MLILCVWTFCQIGTRIFSESVGIMGGLLMAFNNSLIMIQMGASTGAGGVRSHLIIVEKVSIELNERA